MQVPIQNHSNPQQLNQLLLTNNHLLFLTNLPMETLRFLLNNNNKHSNTNPTQPILQVVII